MLRLGRWGDLDYLDRERHLTVVWQAFGHYEQAAKYSAQIRQLRRDEPGSALLPRLYALRARSILFANLTISAVEQDILHQAVGQTINQVPERFTSALTDSAARWGERLAGVPRQVTTLEAPFQMEPVTKSVTEAWARFMTNQILVVILPCEKLRLGKDVPPRSAIAPFFPPDLNDFNSLPMVPAARSSTQDARFNENLCNLVASFDRSLGDGRGSAARDWRRYDDRLNWIVNMMRSRQQDQSLWWSPYSSKTKTGFSTVCYRSVAGTPATTRSKHRSEVFAPPVPMSFGGKPEMRTLTKPQEDYFDELRRIGDEPLKTASTPWERSVTRIASTM